MSAGTLVEEKQDAGSGSPKNAMETSVVTSEKKDPIIMAHFPTQRSSDLSFELFVASVLKHNAQAVNFNFGLFFSYIHSQKTLEFLFRNIGFGHIDQA